MVLAGLAPGGRIDPIGVRHKKVPRICLPVNQWTTVRGSSLRIWKANTRPMGLTTRLSSIRFRADT
jgi:hypothetical protein